MKLESARFIWGEYVNVCYLEQRGAGKSYSPDIPPETMTISQLVEDAKEVTLYLMKKFNQPKIFVLGHSWGTVLGSFLIHKYPEFYSAYIGIGQGANQFESEKLSLKFVLKEAKRVNNKEDLKEIQKLKVPSLKDSGETWFDYIMKERKFLRKYGGVFYNDDPDPANISVKESTEYTDEEKENFFTRKGSRFSLSLLWKTILKIDFKKELSIQQIPIFIFQGIHDHTTEFILAKNYFDILDAPFKKFYAFENSAHCPHLEEYKKFEEIMKKDILKLK